MASPGEDVQVWSPTAASNSNADPLINWAEGQPRASVNNSARSMLAAHAKDRNLKNGSITTAGSANAQTFTSGVGYTSMPAAGLTVRLKVGVSNTAAATLNMDSISAIPIKDQAGNDILSGALTLGRYVDLLYDGTNWVLLLASPLGAPFDALAYNGMQINGRMEVNQPNFAFANLVHGVEIHTIDGWKAQMNTEGILAASTSAGDAVPPVVFGGMKAIELRAVVGAAASAGNLAFLRQNIEGYRVSRMGFGFSGVRYITIGFYVYASATGNLGVTIGNGTLTRVCAGLVTINAATTWEWKTITFPVDTVATDWLYTNGPGLSVLFVATAGTTYQTAPNVWTGTGPMAATGISPLLAVTPSFVHISNVVVLPGAEVPNADRAPFLMRPFGEEQLTCQRYYEVCTADIAGYTGASNGFWSPYPFKATKRAAPTMSAITSGSSSNAMSPAAVGVTVEAFSFQLVAVATGPLHAFSLGTTADARL